MHEDRTNANHPAPGSAQMQREADRKAREAEAIAFNATLVPLWEQWAELRNRLAAVVSGIGNSSSRGWALAYLEDADYNVLMLLDEARETPR